MTSALLNRKLTLAAETKDDKTESVSIPDEADMRMHSDWIKPPRIAPCVSVGRDQTHVLFRHHTNLQITNLTRPDLMAESMDLMHITGNESIFIEGYGLFVFRRASKSLVYYPNATSLACLTTMASSVAMTFTTFTEFIEGRGWINANNSNVIKLFSYDKTTILAITASQDLYQKSDEETFILELHFIDIEKMQVKKYYAETFAGRVWADYIFGGENELILLDSYKRKMQHFKIHYAEQPLIKIADTSCEGKIDAIWFSPFKNHLLASFEQPTSGRPHLLAHCFVKDGKLIQKTLLGCIGKHERRVIAQPNGYVVFPHRVDEQNDVIVSVCLVTNRATVHASTKQDAGEYFITQARGFSEVGVVSPHPLDSELVKRKLFPLDRDEYKYDENYSKLHEVIHSTMVRLPTVLTQLVSQFAYEVRFFTRLSVPPTLAEAKDDVIEQIEEQIKMRFSGLRR